MSSHNKRELRKEGSQGEIGHLFKAIVLRKIVYGLPVYGAGQQMFIISTSS